MARDANMVYLSAVRDGDIFKLIDQDGRKVANVTSLHVSTGVDQLVTVDATFYDAPRNAASAAHMGKDGQQ